MKAGADGWQPPPPLPGAASARARSPRYGACVHARFESVSGRPTLRHIGSSGSGGSGRGHGRIRCDGWLSGWTRWRGSSPKRGASGANGRGPAAVKDLPKGTCEGISSHRKGDLSLTIFCSKDFSSPGLDFIIMEITHIAQLSPARKFSSVSFVQVFSLFVLARSFVWYRPPKIYIGILEVS